MNIKKQLATTYQYFTFDIWWVDCKSCLLEGRNHPSKKKPWFFDSASQAETKIFAPENGWLEDDCYLFGTNYFQGRTVGFRECILGGLPAWTAINCFVFSQIWHEIEKLGSLYEHIAKKLPSMQHDSSSSHFARDFQASVCLRHGCWFRLVFWSCRTWYGILSLS